MHVAFKQLNFVPLNLAPDFMCHGEPGKIWSCFAKGVHSVNEYSTNNNRILVGTANKVGTFAHSRHMCYLPAPNKALFLSHEGWMEAISCETGQQILESEQ